MRGGPTMMRNHSMNPLFKEILTEQADTWTKCTTRQRQMMCLSLINLHLFQVNEGACSILMNKAKSIYSISFTAKKLKRCAYCMNKVAI
ncbi:hypothetical protein FGO68_gene1816 [Halteria grandinella]|uniref:Uncharacterized protein n=1 Tax=Halteria grandinella TaxID=5974 RepID=A0A8J8NMC5_HALGN|nr:hypothetical protein FGO68_gene1816 [Halteria grandinella]